MNHIDLCSLIREKSVLNFSEASDALQQILFSASKADVLPLLKQIGTIPEDIRHDSSEEKLYTKASDILFAKVLKEMNFDAVVLRERSNCADIVAQSKYHNYSLVGDAKAFRLSRTAKNAKDFKVESMVHWKGDKDFSVLVCPYFQYPRESSQIYRAALSGNVALFSWEYLYIILCEDVKESAEVDLRSLWNQSDNIMQETKIVDENKCFIRQQDENLRKILEITEEQFISYFDEIKGAVVCRGNEEIHYYESEIARIQNLNRADAIKELLASMKLESKIKTIKKFINQVQG